MKEWNKLEIDFTFLGIVILILWMTYIEMEREFYCLDNKWELVEIESEWWIDKTVCEFN